MPKPEEKLVENLTKDAEKGESVAEILNQMPFQERLQIAKKMDELNAEHRKADTSLPDLIITSENDTSGAEHLTDIQARTYGKVWNSNKDVYDLPKVAQTEAFDYLVDSRLERDATDSKHLHAMKNKDFYTGSGERK